MENSITEHWYLKTGIVKGWYFYEDVNHKIIINILAKDMFLSMDIHRKVKLIFDVETMKQTTIYKISEANFNKLKKEQPELEEVASKNFTRMMQLLQEKSKFMHYNHIGKRCYETQKHCPFFKELSHEQLSCYVGCGKRTASTARCWTPP